jgi:hypothetical protein
MRFQNVDRQKGDLALVLVIKLVESGNLPPERWSGIAAEDEYDRLARS